MAIIRQCVGRWFGRYRVYFFIGLLILLVQVYLAYKSLAILPYSKTNTISLQTRNSKLRENEQKKIMPSIDDEDNQSNSNNFNSFAKQKNDIIKASYNISKSILQIDNLEFTPPCDIHSREAISAIHRAKTQKCKKFIVNVTCAIQAEAFYPQYLPNFCPNEGFRFNKPLGCFKDEKNYRMLSGYYANYKINNSPKYCSQMCLQSGFPYAGVQYSTECFCGVNAPSSAMKQPDSSCNMKCPGDPKEICGGFFKMNVYETGIAKFSAQTAVTLTTNDMEPKVRIAYLLTLNGRAVRQVYRLIKALFHVDHYFYIHVDSRQDYMFRQLLQLEKNFSNIRLSRNRFSTIWGGASLLQMLLASMTELLKSNWKWDFIINLSESDFPIKSNERLVQFLTANKNKNFVKSHGREVQRFIQKQGLDKTFIECDTHMWRTGDRTLPWGIQIDGGSDWITLTRDFVKYVTQENDELISGLLTVFKHTLLPAESFFHTVLRNSRFCKTYVDNNLHVTNWKRRLGCKCQYKHVVDWCGCSPNDFKVDDWPRLHATEIRQLYFARKFEPIIDQKIILKLEEWLFGKGDYTVNLQSYWQSIFHYADISPSVEDALITISRSLVRINAKITKCDISGIKILEVLSYHNHDKYIGNIIQYEVETDSHGKFKFEMLIALQNHTHISNNTHLSKHFFNIYISSDYDQKEQLSRNFARVIGPFSDILAIYEYLPDSEVFQNHNISLIFIDPSGNVADICDGYIDPIRTINFIKPSLKGPHLPGKWTVKIIHNRKLIAKTIFFITPLEIYLGKEINEEHLEFIHLGNSHYSKSENILNEYKNHLPERENVQILSDAAFKNSKKLKSDLKDWIDSLVSTFYQVREKCLVVEKNEKKTDFTCSDLNLALCETVNWSSLAFDPKSHIGKIDLDTGLLMRL